MRTPRRLLSAVAAAATAATLLTACDADEPVLTVGYDDTVASRTAAAIYAGALARTGMNVQTAEQPRPESELLDEVASGSLGLFPAFTGDLLVRLTPSPDALAADDVLTEVNRSLPEKVTIGDPAAVSDRWQLLLAADAVERAGTALLADCTRIGVVDRPLVALTTPPPEVLAAVELCHTGGVQTVGTIDELVTRVAAGAAGLATALDTAGADDSSAVQTLASDGAPIAQDLVPVFAAGRMEKPQLKALSRVAGDLTTTDLAQMMREVRDGGDPRAVAGRWLTTRGV